MTHDLPFPQESFQEELIEVVGQKPARGVVSVRFSGDEVRELGGEQRSTGVLPTTFIREYTLAAIRAKRRECEPGQADPAD